MKLHAFALRTFVACIRDARKHPELAAEKYRGAYAWLALRISLVRALTERATKPSNVVEFRLEGGKGRRSAGA